MRTGIASRSYRVVTAGAKLRLLALAAEPNGCVGVDLETGAFVRAAHPTSSELPSPFDVVSGEMAGTIEPPDPARPEALELAGVPQRIGSMPPKRAARLLAPLHHPPQLPLLGFHATAVPYWTLTGDRPSLALVELRSDARVRWGAFGPECHFLWQGALHELMLADQRVLGALEAGAVRPSRGDVQRLLGYRPRRLLVMLTSPLNGYCHKAVGALLPGT